MHKASARNVSLYLGVVTTVGLYVAVGAPIFIDRIIREHSPAHLEPQATSDEFLSVLEAPRPTALIEQALHPFAADQPLLFVGAENEPSWGQALFTISYLAYPRPVSGIRCVGAGMSSYVIDKVPAGSEVAGLLFFKLDPGRWAAGGRRIAPALYISPASGARPWQSYCP